MERDARPLPPKAHSLLIESADEEIHNGSVKYGLPVLLGLSTGLRKRVLVHYQDSWREETNDGDQIRIPKQIECPLREDGCPYCNKSMSRGPDGFLKAKTGQGEQRVIPLPESWRDTYSGETKQTGLRAYLDNFFKYNDSWGYLRSHINSALKRVVKRRYDGIARSHEGEVERTVFAKTQIVPDVTVHDLRASWCTQCLRCGVNETTLMDWGGWENADMIDHYRGFVGDPGGAQRQKLEGDNSSTDNTDMGQVYEVYSLITSGEKIDPTQYDNATLEAAYELVRAESN